MISQDGSVDAEYADIAFLVNRGTILAIFPKISQSKHLMAEYDSEKDAVLEMSTLHSTYVRLRDNPGCYRFSDKEIYKK